jgi:hypothetical protein
MAGGWSSYHGYLPHKGDDDRSEVDWYMCRHRIQAECPIVSDGVLTPNRLYPAQDDAVD